MNAPSWASWWSDWSSWWGGWVQRYPDLSLAWEVLVAALAGLLVHTIVHRLLQRLGRSSVMAERLVRYARRAAQWLLPLLFVQAVLADSEVSSPRLQRWLGIAVILLVTALVIRLIQAAADVIQARYPLDAVDNLRARSVSTQTRVLTRTAMSLVGLVGVASVLMTFPSVRQLGASLLASAGVAGIVAGLAARPVLGNLLAGLQIAIAQPIRLDDVLIVEGEWGRVEEITGSYVVVRIWDDRRLILPLSYFIEKPFQNWTRRTSDLIGTVFLWVDYGLPLAPLREELQRLCEAAPDWDRRVCLLQVTDTSERAMQLRVLVSSRDAGSGWDLRCHVREGLIAYLQAHHPQHLPRSRNELLHGGPMEADGLRRSVAAVPGDGGAMKAEGQATP